MNHVLKKIQLSSIDQSQIITTNRIQINKKFQDQKLILILPI